MHTNKGFSIVELLVASALFITVVSVAAGSFLSTLDASKRARELQELSTNLDFVLEDMSRNMRTGENFTSCSDGVAGSCIAFETYAEEGLYGVQYWLDGNGNVLKSGGTAGLSSSGVSLTTSDIEVTDLVFDIDSGGDTQPRITINLVAETTGDIAETFYLQTSVTQRVLDN